MVSPEKTVKMLKERRNGRKGLEQRNFRPLYIEDNIGVEMVISVKAFFMKNHRKKGEKMN